MTITADGRTRSDPYLQDANTTAHVVAAFALQTPFRTVDAKMIPVLAYMADRQHCILTGAPILHAERASTPIGPVNATVAALVSEDPMLRPSDEMRAAWSSMLERRGSRIRLRPGITADDLDELSRAHWDSIEKTWQAFGTMDDVTFMTWARSRSGMIDDPLAEWDPVGVGSIPIEATLMGIGMDAATAAECAQHERDMRGVSLVLHGY